MIQYFKNIDGNTEETDKVENGIWVNIVPPFKEEEFIEISEQLNIPIEFLKDSLDIDERSRYDEHDNVKLFVIKTPTENNSFNESDAHYITIPVCIILSHNHIVTVNSFDNVAIKRFLASFKEYQSDRKRKMTLRIFDKVVQTYLDYLKDINHKRNHFEQNLYKQHNNEDLIQLMRLQKSLVYYVTALRSNELLMMKLLKGSFLHMSDEEKDYLEDIIVDNSQALEMANIYTNILDSTLNTFSAMVQNSKFKLHKQIGALLGLVGIPYLFFTVLTNGMILSGHWLSFLLFMIVLSLGGGVGYWFLKRK